MKRHACIFLSLVTVLMLRIESHLEAQVSSDSIGLRLFEDDGQTWDLRIHRDSVWQHHVLPLSAFGSGNQFLNTPVTKFVIIPIGGGGLIGGPLVEVVDWIDELVLADSLIDDFDDGVYADWFWDIALNGSYLNVSSSTNTPDASPRCIQLVHGNTMGQQFAGYIERRSTGLSLAPDDTLRVWLRGTSYPLVSVPDDRNKVLLMLALHQNFPNPFNPSTVISYHLPAVSHVTLKVYDILGREIATLVDVVEDAGLKSVKFDASNLASGVYFYRLNAGTFTSLKKMLVVR